LSQGIPTIKESLSAKGQLYKQSLDKVIYLGSVVQSLCLVVQSWISAKPGLTLEKTYTVNPGLVLIQL